MSAGATGDLSEGARIETVLPRLAAAYDRGLLVPFIGAGLSAPTCRLWDQFIPALEELAGVRTQNGSAIPDELVQRGNRAIRRLRALSKAEVAAAVRTALHAGGTQPPAQTVALARLYWPLVVTTNYDDCVVTAFRDSFGQQMTVRGREPKDCQIILAALGEPSPPLLWAIQGYLGGPCGDATDCLADQIVVGHEEYRRVAHAEPHFRRAFAEVFRNRSMLFLGSGLREPYFREMFSEVLEIYGPCRRPHYAFVKRGEVDVQFLATRFQTIVVEYEHHSEVPFWLDQLAAMVSGRAFRQDRFTFALRNSEPEAAGQNHSRLDIVQARLPLPDSGKGECLAVSAGGEGDRFFFSSSIRALLQRAGVKHLPVVSTPGSYVARFGTLPVYAVRAREQYDMRSLRSVRLASTELYDTAWADGHRRVLQQVLASGGSASGVDLQPFTPLFSFIESVRAFGIWARKHPDRALELVVHVVDPSVYFEIARGRVDVLEVLSSIDLRFWATIVYADGKIERQMCQEREDVTLGCLADWLGLDPNRWSVESIPPVHTADTARSVPVLECMDDALASRVIPGGTLQFTVNE